MKVVIMAGGKGTRISSIAKDIPKPMIKIGDKPVLEHTIECLSKQGFKDIIITVAHLSEIIIKYFGDGSKKSPVTGKNFDVHIEYYIENEALGNAGALFKIKDKFENDFLLINGDIIFDVDLWRFIEYHRKKQGLVTLFTHPNSHPYDSGLIIANKSGVVERWLTKEEERKGFYKNRVNAGIHIISPRLLEQELVEDKVDLDRQLLKPLVSSGKIYAYDSSEYVKDMGTPERYESVYRDYEQGKIKARNFVNKQKAIFIDRDGTINRYVGFLKDIEQFELLEGVPKAIKMINDSEYLAIVVTNQPVVARGEVSFEELENIHNKMESLLGLEGAYVDGIYFCPHHPDKGYDGEVSDLKISCSCRKPKPGMLLNAAKDFNIDLTKSWMIGDSEQDIKAGIDAGCKTVYLNENYCNDCAATIQVRTLLEFSKKFFDEN